MKLQLTLLLTLIPLLGLAEKEEKKVDPVGGREIIKLDEGKAYILTSGEGKYQIELTIEKNGYGLAQLANDGTGIPPIVLIAEGKNIEVNRNFIEQDGQKEKWTVVSDKTSNGLADTRMIIEKEKGSTQKITVEELETISKSKTEKTFDANQTQ